jgi:hypothetical protein
MNTKSVGYGFFSITFYKKNEILISFILYIITNTRKDKIMSSIPICEDALRNLLNDDTPFSNFHPNYVANSMRDRELSSLRKTVTCAFCLKYTDTMTLEEEGVDTPINRDDIKAVYEMALTMLKPKQKLGLSYIPSSPSPAVETVSEDAYNHVHHLHFAIQTWS